MSDVYYVVFYGHRDLGNRPAPPVQHIVPRARASAPPYWAICGRNLRVSPVHLCPVQDPTVPVCLPCVKAAGRPEGAPPFDRTER